jgi:hypothetical protein
MARRVFTVLNETPIAFAMERWVISLSRSNTVWMRRNFPARDCFQFPNLLLDAVDHLFPRIG